MAFGEIIKPESKDISEFNYNNYYGGIEYGFYNPERNFYYFTTCRAHSVWALMAYMQGTANFKSYCFQDKESVTIYLGGCKDGYFEKLVDSFRNLESRFNLLKTKFFLVQSKNGKNIIKVKSTRFWIKSIQIYSLFLLLLRRAEKDFFEGQDVGYCRYYKSVAKNIPELIRLTKKHTQEFGWSTKVKYEMDELGWDNKFHDYGVTEFFEDQDESDYRGYRQVFYSFQDLKNHIEQKVKKTS